MLTGVVNLHHKVAINPEFAFVRIGSEIIQFPTIQFITTDQLEVLGPQSEVRRRIEMRIVIAVAKRRSPVIDVLALQVVRILLPKSLRVL